MTFPELALSFIIAIVAVILVVGAMLSLIDWVTHKKNLSHRKRRSHHGN